MITQLSVGFSHVLALAEDGGVYAWGNNTFGQTAAGNRVSGGPIRVTGLPPIRAVSAGENASYALSRDGRVYAWGDASVAQLGMPAGLPQPLPRLITDLTAVSRIETGSNHVFAIR